MDTSVPPHLKVGDETQVPYLTALLCNEVLSAKESPQLGEGCDVRLPLISVTLELFVFV